MKALVNITYGAMFGVACVIPGVSGATIAVIFGFYEQLTESVSDIFKSWRKNFMFLLFFAIGMAIGVFGFAMLVNFLLELSTLVVFFAFIGLILGSIPSIHKKSKMDFKKMQPYEVVGFIFGGLVMIALALIQDTGSGILPVHNDTLMGVVILVIVGFVASVGPVVPGISGGLLLVLATGDAGYKAIVGAVSSLDIGLLLPFALGAVLGVFLFAKLVNFLLHKYFKTTFSVIMGLVMFSVIPLWMPLSFNLESLIAVVVCLACAAVTFFFVEGAAEKMQNAVSR